MNRTTDELEITKSLGLSGEVYQGNRWMEHKKIMETLFQNSTKKIMTTILSFNSFNWIETSKFYRLFNLLSNVKSEIAELLLTLILRYFREESLRRKQNKQKVKSTYFYW